MNVSPGAGRPLAADERELLDRLIREFGPRLLGYVRRTYGPRIDAEEIVAESFCRAAANMPTFKACDRQDLYLLTTARNLCRDRFRRQRDTGTGDGLDQYPASIGRPDKSVTQTERREALLAAIDGLPVVQREVVTLRLSGTLKFEEIAQLLGVPLGTVLSRMHAGLQRLKQRLGSSDER
ncbi:MAG: sigma-70 family RNA polymerase sigma factor [Phycisphaerae bacterium]|jgi:RNA polymerase sigma-70 factor (ECF subfamily)